MRPSLRPSSDVASHLGRIGHDLGLAGLLGGQLFGRLALHPAVTAISDERERGAVVNAAWRRYGAVNALGLAAVTAGWVGGRLGEVRDANLEPRERRLARIKDGLLATTFAVGTATAVEGVRFSRQAPGGAVPLADGDHAAPAATARQARTKRRLNVLGAAAIGAEIALVAVNAALAQTGFRRAPLRRRWRRGG